MEDFKSEKKEQEIVFSKSIKAGKRIYYLDVKQSRNKDLFLAITESKKKVTGFDENMQVSYEKHKIFLYKEDFDKFAEGLSEVIDFIKRENPVKESFRRYDEQVVLDEAPAEEVKRSSIDFDIDFDV